MVSPPPLIGISTSEVRSPGDRELVSQGEPARTELALGERYLDAVRAGGGMPVILAPVGPDEIETLVARALTEQRLVLNATGPDTVRLLPPLNASDADLDEAVSRIGALLLPAGPLARGWRIRAICLTLG